MKAIVVDEFCAYDRAVCREVAAPAPGPGEVVIDLHVAEVNYPDLLVIEGRYQVKPPLPFSPGKGAAGVIAATGEGVDSLRPGDRVAVQVEYGAYAEKLLAPAANCTPLPDAVSFETGAALGLAYQTAYFALADRAPLRPGERVLVLGASGGVGAAAVQLAKALGAGQVIAAVRGPEKAAFAAGLGADHVVDLAMDDLREGLRAAVHALSGGAGMDIVIDPVGGAATGAALRTLAWCGRIFIVGFAAGEIPQLPANYLLLKNISAIGLHWSDYRERDPARVRAAQRRLFELYLDGKLAPPITGRFPLADYARALKVLHDGRARGKIILTLRD